MKNGEGQVIPGAIPVVYYTSLPARRTMANKRLPGAQPDYLHLMTG